jgi:large conductance mechanosensitive channel
MGMISEFKAFVSRGNVIDLAVAVVIGAAFGKVITALVDGIVMPVIATLTGGISVADWKFVVTPARFVDGKQVAAELAITYGAFLQSVIDFVLVALVVFLVLKAYNRMRAPADAPAAPTEDVLLLREIRDALRR